MINFEDKFIKLVNKKYPDRKRMNRLITILKEDYAMSKNVFEKTFPYFMINSNAKIDNISKILDAMGYELDIKLKEIVNEELA